MSGFDVPIVLTVFNRPEQTARVFDVVRAVQPATLLLVADGPRVDHPDDGARCEAVRRRYEGQNIPRPERWGGFRVTPESIEFWSDREHRLHERRLFTRTVDGWHEGLLYP